MISMLLDHHDWLKIPEIHWEATTERVLTMEYCEGNTNKQRNNNKPNTPFCILGGHVNDLSYLKSQGIDPASISSKISAMYADMIFKLGYVHCDPHPGNVLVQKGDDGKPRVVLLDHGLYTQLTYEFRQNYAHVNKQ